MLTPRALAIPLLLCSCATMTSGRNYCMVPVDSVPRGAVVTYRGVAVGVTPCTIAMRPIDTKFTLSLHGYHDQVVHNATSGNAAVLGNLLVGGLVGVAVDATSGASVSMSDRPCWVALTPASDPEPGIWIRPPAPPEPTGDDDGWIPEGQVSPRKVDVPTPAPTRAPSANDSRPR